jgi:hypothetical protein
MYADKIKAAMKFYDPDSITNIETIAIISNIKIRIDDYKYLICTDYEANREFKNHVQSLWEDSDLDCFSDTEKEYILNNIVDMKWFDEAMKNHFKKEIASMDIVQYNKALDREGINKITALNSLELLKALCKKYSNGMEWYRECHNETELEAAIIENKLLDIDKLAGWLRNERSRGHYLSYDNCGYYIDGFYIYKVD